MPTPHFENGTLVNRGEHDDVGGRSIEPRLSWDAAFGVHGQVIGLDWQLVGGMPAYEV